ncbi:MAG: hypothetical protein M1830_005780 [Pleopsidium flavum]|nr:MAG: hypothetical protein M1830_005780 [Pleopsidium flavum]
MAMEERHQQTGCHVPSKAYGIRVSHTNSEAGHPVTKDEVLGSAAPEIDSNVWPGSVQSWKPMTLRAPILGSVVAVSILLIVTLELLSSKSRQDGGVIFAGRMDDISAGQSFAYLYLPTIIAVAYSMLWSWVDLDAKRLEPYFQLSKPEGALAKSSLLLQYPVDFLALVPLKAARRRHWSVFCAGSAMMLIFWAITPLQSAIFATDTRALSHSLPIDSISPLLPPEDQTSLLDTGFMNDAYSILWLGKKLPAFTTRDFALQPFGLRTSDLSNQDNSNWTASTLLYSTQLSCAPADFAQQKDTTYTFSNRKNCTVSEIALTDERGGGHRYFFQYIGYYDSAEADYALEQPSCPPSASHNYLALWGDGATLTGTETYPNLTAMFCESSYYVQDVNATVNLPGFTVSAVSPTSSKRELSNDTFNITNFEYIIGTGASPLDIRRDYPNEVVLEQYPRLSEMSLVWPMSNMVGFALGNPNITIDKYSDPKLLQEGFESAHKLLFAMAVRQLTGPSTWSRVKLIGQQSTQLYTVFVIRAFAIAVEACLAVVAALALCLLYLSWKRTSNLCEDPASIAHVMSLLSDRASPADTLSNFDMATSIALEKHLQDMRYRITRQKENDTSVPKLEVLSHSSECKEKKLQSSQFKDLDQSYRPVRPLELKATIGLPLIFMLLAFIVIIVVLYIYTLLRSGMCSLDKLVVIELTKYVLYIGLPPPSQSAVGQQILLNYLPTAFATFLEPIWVVLNRILCIMHPFEVLRHGNAKKSCSLDLKYTSLPPPFVFWRAIRARHLVLASVCAITVLANPLVVTLSSLFEDKIVDVEQHAGFDQLYSPLFNQTRLTTLGQAAGAVITYKDHFYVAKTNISDGTALPPWVTQEFFFIPFGLKIAPNLGSNATYRAVTRGFGIDSKCRQFNSSRTGGLDHFSLSVDGSQFNASTSQLADDGRIVKCVVVATNASDVPNYPFGAMGPPSSGNSALEVVSSMYAVSSPIQPIKDQDFCKSLLLAGWVRASRSDQATTNFSSSLASGGHTISSSSMFMSCQPSLKTAEFIVTVDSTGQVLGTAQTGNFDTNAAKYLNANATFPYNQTSDLIGTANVRPSWHNDTFAPDWINYLIKRSTNSTAITDPNAPLPDFAPTAAIIQELHRRLFAILLGLNIHVLVSAPPNAQVSGIITSQAHRIFMSKTMFIISIVLLSLNVIVALLYYLRRPKTFLSRMPTTIASVIAFVAASRALAEMHGDCRRNGSEKSKLQPGNKAVHIPAAEPQPKELRFGFGKFIGTDGKPHVGIERHPLVVPLDLNALKSVGRRKGTGTSKSNILGQGKTVRRVEEGDSQPDELRTSPWKPVTLRSLGLGSLLAFTVLLVVVVVEAFREISSRDGGILFADSLDDLPGVRTFAYLYLPTIVAVTYGIAWAWVDLDVKRMEPYFQLSTPEGAIASDSMLLSYPHGFLPFVPIKAARRKHWAVVCSSMVTLLISWGITPFQNAAIGQKYLLHTEEARFLRSPGPIPLEQQLHVLSAEFFYTGDNIAWPKSRGPPFMTSKAAYDAARLETLTPHRSAHWSFPSREYSAKLEFVPGISQGHGNFTDGRGCFSSIPFGHESSFIASQYSLYQVDGICTIGGRLTFALVWLEERSPNDTVLPTALFCNPRHIFYDTNITTSPDGAILSATRTSPAQDMPLSKFNLTRFEQFMSMGKVPDGTKNVNFPVDRLPLAPQAMRFDTDAIVGYVIDLRPANHTEHISQSALQDNFEAAYNLLFVSAFHSLSSHSTGN